MTGLLSFRINNTRLSAKMDEIILVKMPTELLHLLVFELGILSPLDVLRLALTSSVLHSALLSAEFDVAQHRVLAGVLFCVRRNWERAAKLAFLRNAPDLCVIGQEVLTSAMSHSMVDIVELLIADPRVDPTAKNNNAIRMASRNGHTETVALLLADPRVEGILIATSNRSHRPLIEQAAAAGKAVFVDKPLTTTMSDGLAAVEAAEAAGIVLQVGHQRPERRQSTDQQDDRGR